MKSGIEPFYVALGDRIRDARLRRNVSQDALSFALGLTRASMANIENANQRVYAHYILVIAAALGIEAAELLDAKPLAPKERKAIEARFEKERRAEAKRRIDKLQAELDGARSRFLRGDGRRYRRRVNQVKP